MRISFILLVFGHNKLRYWACQVNEIFHCAGKVSFDLMVALNEKSGITKGVRTHPMRAMNYNILACYPIFVAMDQMTNLTGHFHPQEPTQTVA